MIFELISNSSFWAPVATSTVLIGAAGAVLSPWYRGWIEGGIRKHYDSQIEELRSDFRREEDRLRAEMKAQDDRLVALRSGALTGLATRQGLLDRKRIDALEAIWDQCVGMQRLKTIARAMETINVPELLKASQGGADSAVIQFATLILSTGGITDNDAALPSSASSERLRPFAPPLVWALYSTYRLVVWLPVAQLIVAKSGAGPKMLADSRPLVDLVISALPHQKAFLEQYGVEGLAFLVGELEEKLHAEIVAALGDTSIDQRTVVAAAAIVASSQVIEAPPPQPPNASLRSTVKPPTGVEEKKQDVRS